MILRAFWLSVEQLSDPRFRRVLGLGVGLALALLIGATAGLIALVQGFVTDEVGLPIVGTVTWVDDILSIGSVFVMLILSVFLMVPVASAITSMFLEDVAQAVEDRHYAHLPPAQRVPFSDALRDTLNFLGVLVIANVLALVLYIMFAPVALFIFWGLNGFLLGREYFTMAAMRRVGRVKAKELRGRHTAKIWLAGVLMAVPLSVPLVNLLIPVLGAATFTHIFHALNSDR
jgi:uncharacterized protein involved in cysteine biosynthesis